MKNQRLAAAAVVVVAAAAVVVGQLKRIVDVGKQTNKQTIETKNGEKIEFFCSQRRKFDPQKGRGRAGGGSRGRVGDCLRANDLVLIRFRTFFWGKWIFPLSLSLSPPPFPFPSQLTFIVA